MLGRRTISPLANIPNLVDLSEFEASRFGISRQHAQIKYQDGIYMLQDVGSSNGTKLNDEYIDVGRDYALKDGDLIILSSLLIIFHCVNPKK